MSNKFWEGIYFSKLSFDFFLLRKIKYWYYLSLLDFQHKPGRTQWFSALSPFQGDGFELFLHVFLFFQPEYTIRHSSLLLAFLSGLLVLAEKGIRAGHRTQEEDGAKLSQERRCFTSMTITLTFMSITPQAAWWRRIGIADLDRSCSVQGVAILFNCSAHATALQPGVVLLTPRRYGGLFWWIGGNWSF